MSAQKHFDLAGKKVTVLAGTGPVGMRIGQLCAAAGAEVKICSRRLERAESVCELIESRTGNRPAPVQQAAVPTEARSVVTDTEILFAAGAAGVSYWMKAGKQAANRCKWRSISMLFRRWVLQALM